MTSTAQASATQRAANGFITVGLNALLVGVAVLYCLGRADGGQLSTLSAPWALQCWLAFVAILVMGMLFGRWRTSLAASLLTLWSGLVVVPSVLPQPTVHARDTFSSPVRAMSINVNLRNAPSPYALQWIRNERPDVLALIEMSTPWRDAMAGLADDFPYAYTLPDSATARGIGLYSRYPIVDALKETTCLECQPLIEASIEHPLGLVRVFAIHPLSPMNDERTQWRDAELRLIAERCAAVNVPTIVLGDFNETPYGSAFQGFLKRTGYTAARSVEGFSPTWPAQHDGILIPSVFRIPIDHIVVSPHFDALSFAVGPPIGSDHLPIVAQLGLVSMGDQPRTTTRASVGTSRSHDP